MIIHIASRQGLPVVLLVLLVNLMSQPLLVAQDQVELQFLSFPKIANPTPVELLSDKGKTISVEIPTNRISQTYTVSRAAEWVLGETVKDDKGKETFSVFGKAPALAVEKQLILITRKGQDNASGLVLVPINNLPSNLGGGTYLFINLSTMDIAGQLGESKFALRPSDHAILRPSPTMVNGIYEYTAPIFYYRNKEATKPFFSSTWRLNHKARSIVIFYEDPTSKKLRFHSIRDYL